MLSGVVWLLLATLLFGSDVTSTLEKESSLEWWQKAVFYQIFPRSFKDSDNDGIGDIPGFTSKLDHLVDCEVDAIWLSPIYKSPMVDGGYDISDYKDIAPEYGTLIDFEYLLTEAHAKDLKVILDFVPNHTSDQHDWFNRSVNREDGYSDYYVWADARYDENGTRIPPNNWLSVWRNSGWEWHEVRQQYYFHQFSTKQPDLNLRSERVQSELKDIMRFWLDLGVDGFRIDAVPHIYEDVQLRDEPVDPSAHVDPTNYNYLKHIYTKDQNETFDLIYDWREFVDDYTATAGGETRILMTECATELEKVVRYYGTDDGARLGAHFSFNFYLIGLRDYNRPADIKYAVDEWTNKLPSIYTLNWLTGNHDNHRVASRVGVRNIDGYNMVLMFLPGISITYMGEEIGQEDGEVTCAQGQDPSAIGNCTTFNETSRDFERTPYQWDNTTNAGFDQGAPTWLPVSAKYKETNLKNQTGALRSHFKTYKQLVKIKRLALNATSLQVGAASDPDVLQVGRSTQDGDGFLLLFNMGDEVKDVQIEEDTRYTVLAASVGSIYWQGDFLLNQVIVLSPGDSIILQKVVG